MTNISTLASCIGKGLVAGFVGNVAMTASSTIEQKVRQREASGAPAKAAERVLGIEKFASDAAENRFSNLVHWGYGSGWGAMRGLLRATGASPVAATGGHFAAIWGSALVTLPVLDVAPPITMWGRTEIAIDVWHHLVYVTATGIAYEALDRAAENR
jgi:hypothetical protein